MAHQCCLQKKPQQTTRGTTVPCRFTRSHSSHTIRSSVLRARRMWRLRQLQHSIIMFLERSQSLWHIQTQKLMQPKYQVRELLDSWLPIRKRSLLSTIKRNITPKENWQRLPIRRLSKWLQVNHPMTRCLDSRMNNIDLVAQYSTQRAFKRLSHHSHEQRHYHLH